MCDKGEKGLHVRKGAKEKHQKTRPSAPQMWQSWVDTCPHTDTPETREAERWEELEVLFLLWLEVAWPHTLLLGPCYWLPVSVATISGNRSGIRRTTESSCNRTWDDPLPDTHSHTHTRTHITKHLHCNQSHSYSASNICYSYIRTHETVQSPDEDVEYLWRNVGRPHQPSSLYEWDLACNLHNNMDQWKVYVSDVCSVEKWVISDISDIKRVSSVVLHLNYWMFFLVTW